MVQKTAAAQWRRRPRLLSDGSVPERVIQAQILQWLKDAGILHWRQQSGTVFLGHRSIRMGPEGLPDIVVIVPPNGKVVGLEVKSAKGRLRPSQVSFKERLTSVGGSFLVVRSLTQAMECVAKEMGGDVWKLRQPSDGKDPKGFGPN